MPLVGLAAMDDDSGPCQSSTNMTSQEVDKGSLEWWQMPGKFKRRHIDQKECDVINVSFDVSDTLESNLSCSNTLGPSD